MLPALALAQRGGGARGGGGNVDFQLTRLEILSADFKLNKDQKKNVKAILDEAHKTAAPIRDALARTRAAISSAIQSNRAQPDIDAAVAEYAAQAAQMTALEMTALAQVVQTLDPEQRSNSAGVRSAFFMMRGIFLDKRRWDDVPDYRSY
jgi:Spy/CpxP family protein refolding chaperone